MNSQITKQLPNFLATLGLDEEPLGLIYTDQKPDGGFSPEPMDLPTREKEKKGEIDWQDLFNNFSCIMAYIWRARKKKTAAYFSEQHFGCPGATYWLGYNKPQTEATINYVSTGIPGVTTGELYCMSPDTLRQVYEQIDPVSAPKKYCVFKPLSLFNESQIPDIIVFFCRPESLCGLHELAFFVTDDPEVVTSPWSAACGSIAAWPFRYMARGENRAVIGGWDASARKYFKTDELSFAIPFQMFTRMLDLYQESFLTTKDWSTVKKKISISNKAWGESSSV